MKYSHTAISSLSFLLLVGCGSSSQVGANANASSAGSSPNVAARATEPRTNDPTAAQSSPSTATTGVAATLSGEPSPSSSSKSEAKTATEEATPPKPFGTTATSTSNAQKNEADLPKKISARHVLVQWMGSQKAAPSIVRSKEQAFAVVQDVLKRAKKGEDFARLAVEFSDEPGAGNRGGSLGRFGRGTMVPQFDQVAFRLDVGQVSEIVETPFGFHVIQRTE